MREILGSVRRDGVDKLALRIRGRGARPQGSLLGAFLRSKGALSGPEGLSEWRVEGISEEGDELYVFGPAFEGDSLDELCARIPARGQPEGEGPSVALAGLQALATAASGLSAMAGAQLLPAGLVSSGILVGPGVRVLVLPPEPVKKAFWAADEESRAGAAAYLRSSLAEGAEAESAFLLAQAVYLAASGVSPFPAPPAPGVDIASGDFVPLALLLPRLDPDVAAAVDSVLVRPGRGGLSLLEEALSAASGRGWLRDLSPAEETAAARRLAAARRALANRDRRRSFLVKRRGLLIGAATAVVLALALGLGIAQARGARLDYSALDSRALVEAYYRAVGSLDLESMEACASKGAAKADTAYATTQFVVSRARQAYEGRNPVIWAEDWLRAGSPPLEPGKVLFGITGVTVSDVSAGADESAYRVEYSSWSVETDQAGEAAEGQAPRPLERRLRDRLLLRRDPKKGWRIVSIQREER